MLSQRAKFVAPALLVIAGLSIVPAMGANLALRQYYDTTWTYSPTYSYYYVSYYYQPYPTQTTYDYHYCIYYPSQPSYVYYYNPSTQAYWGRFKLGSKEGEQYSMLEPKDRKKELEAIPESAFPTPGPMPTIPGAKDGVAMEPPPENVPKGAK